MKRITTAVLAVVLSLGSGCGIIGTIPTESFSVTLCGEGVIPIPCKSLGQVKIPEGGDALVSVVVAVAGSYLVHEKNLRSCTFTTYPEAVDRKIMVTATAACLLQGVPVSEKLTVTLEPSAVTT